MEWGIHGGLIFRMLIGLHIWGTYIRRINGILRHNIILSASGGFSIINLIGGRGMELLFSVPYTGLSVLYLIEVRDMGRYPG